MLIIRWIKSVWSKNSWLKAFFFIGYKNSWQHIRITKPLYKYKNKVWFEKDYKNHPITSRPSFTHNKSLLSDWTAKLLSLASPFFLTTAPTHVRSLLLCHCSDFNKHQVKGRRFDAFIFSLLTRRNGTESDWTLAGEQGGRWTVTELCTGTEC